VTLNQHTFTYVSNLLSIVKTRQLERNYFGYTFRFGELTYITSVYKWSYI